MISAGLVVLRRREAGAQALLVHPGGPFWARRDLGAWSIPKGLVEPGETPLAAALREVAEEIGQVPPPPYRPLQPIRQKGGKIVVAFAAEGDLDLAGFASNLVEVEWPRGSGRRLQFPECDRAEWFDLAEAARRILPAQAPLLEEATALIFPAP